MCIRLILSLVAFYLINAARLFAEAPAKPAFKVGATLALSGKLAYMGQAELEGLQLAAAEVNQSGGINGRELKLLVEDNLGEPKAAAAGVQKLLAVDQVEIVFSAFTHITQAIKGIVAASGKVMIYESGLRAIAESNPMFFRDYYDSQDSGRVVAAGVKRRALSRVALLSELNDACLEFSRAFKEQAAADGIEIVREETYNTGETDFRPLLLKIKSARPDALVLGAWRDTALVMKQLKETGMLSIPTYHFVGRNAPESDTPEIRALFEENRGVSSWYGFSEGSRTAQQQRLVERFKARFQHEPRSDAAFTYDDLWILAEALRKCSSPDAVDQKCIAARLAETDYDGAAGRLQFNAQRVSSRQVFLIRVEQGRWVDF